MRVENINSKQLNRSKMKEGKLKVKDETEYLMSSEENKNRLLKSIEHINNGGKLISKQLK